MESSKGYVGTFCLICTERLGSISTFHQDGNEPELARINKSIPRYLMFGRPIKTLTKLLLPRSTPEEIPVGGYAAMMEMRMRQVWEEARELMKAFKKVQKYYYDYISTHVSLNIKQAEPCQCKINSYEI